MMQTSVFARLLLRAAGRSWWWLLPLAVGLALSLCSPVSAAVKNMHIEWQYDTSLPGLAGFRIYQNGTLIHEIADPTALTADITVTFTGDATFTMTAFDTDGLESPPSEPYLVRYSDINTAPQIAAGNYAVAEDEALAASLTATDEEGDPLTYTVVSQPAHGTLDLDPATGAFTYTPAADFNGSDSFVFTVSDGWAESPPATAQITVTPVNDPPLAAVSGPTGKVDPGATVTLDGSGSTDPDDGIASVSWRQVGGPTVQLADAAGLQPTFTVPATGPRGTPLVFELTVTDNGGLTATSTVSVQVRWPLPRPAIQVLTAMR